MIVFSKGNSLLLGIAMCLTVDASAQRPADPAKIPAYRTAVIKTVIERVQKKHLAPKPVDDVFSQGVWMRFLQTIDPNSYIFLQEDIDYLSNYRSQIDEQLLAGNTDFYDEARALYCRRAAEAAADYRQLMAVPFTFETKETVKHIRKEEPFAASRQERKELWRKLLKYYTLRNYMDLVMAKDSSALVKHYNAQTGAKAHAKVKKAYDNFFRIAQTQQSADEQFEAYVNVVCMEFDAHTTYAGPQNNMLSEMINKKFFGLGIELENNDGDYFIKRMRPGGTAFRSGVIKEKDQIVAIADANNEMQQVSGLPDATVVGMIRGEKGTAVKMEVRQTGEQARTVVVERDEIIDTENKAKSAVIVMNGKRYGLVRLNDFYIDATGVKMGGAAYDVHREMQRLKDEEVVGVMIDLRGNGGGALDEVVKMCSDFIPGGPVSWLRGRDRVNQYACVGEKPFYQGPLIVMVDESSASASEIFAAAMQDYGRGIILGTSSSFGKGTAQQNLTIGKMGDKEKGTEDVRYGSMRLTMEKFFRVSGASTQLRGVVPDIVVQPAMNFLAFTEKDYATALAYDSLVLPPFKPVSPYWNTRVVVEKAQARIAANPAYNGVAAHTGQLKLLVKEEAALDLEGFDAHYREWNSHIQAIAALKQLPAGKRLQVALTTDRNINPLLRKDEENTKLHQEWLQRIAQDVYVAESIAVMEDMFANELPKTMAAKQ